MQVRLHLGTPPVHFTIHEVSLRTLQYLHSKLLCIGANFQSVLAATLEVVGTLMSGQDVAFLRKEEGWTWFSEPCQPN